MNLALGLGLQNAAPPPSDGAAALAEITQFDFTGLDGSNLWWDDGGTPACSYIVLYKGAEKYIFYFTTIDGSDNPWADAQPAEAADFHVACNGLYYDAAATDADIAAAFQAAVEANGWTTVASAGASRTVSYSSVTGPQTDATDSHLGVSITVTQQGS